MFDSKDSAGLNTEEIMLMEKNYRNFILGGAGLSKEEKARFREITEKLSRSFVKFEKNVLDDTNLFELHITNKTDLAGLPDGVTEMASMEAKTMTSLFTLLSVLGGRTFKCSFTLPIHDIDHCILKTR